MTPERRADAACGLYRLPAEGGVTALLRAESACDFAHRILELRGVRNKHELLERFARDLAFPDWFGSNWDALQDCLTDLSWLPAPGYVFVLAHCDEFREAAPDDFRILTQVLTAAADFWRSQAIPFRVLLDTDLGGIPELPAAPST